MSFGFSESISKKDRIELNRPFPVATAGDQQRQPTIRQPNPAARHKSDNLNQQITAVLRATRKAISPLLLRYFFVISPLFLRYAIEEITLKYGRSIVEMAEKVLRTSLPKPGGTGQKKESANTGTETIVARNVPGGSPFPHRRSRVAPKGRFQSSSCITASLVQSRRKFSTFLRLYDLPSSSDADSWI